MNTKRMTCRLATLADLDLLAALNEQLMQDEGHPNDLTRQQLADRMRTWLQGEHRAVIFEEGQDLVAYALYCVGERSPTDRFIFLRHFFVQRPLRRKGIGREAVRLLLTEVFPPNARVLLDVLYHNQAARAFWQKLGFTEHCLTFEKRGAEFNRE
ncbi:MAG: GNAT family N-acetyltransferase [Verrucomicrobia bacterium]|nr:GNAT family N-acetyltransferase [Verrucomicrobiota bacterium]